jgi:hypothetical protein
MHEELSRYSLDPSGYSGRVLGWSRAVGEGPCQTFAVYRDGVWKTKGVFVAKARGRVDDPDDVLNGFCLRILGRLIDLAATTGGVGLRWSDAGGYSLARFSTGRTPRRRGASPANALRAPSRNGPRRRAGSARDRDQQAAVQELV